MTLQALIQRAARMLNRIAVGSEVEGEEAVEALAIFQAMILSLPALGLGGPLTEVVISDDYTAGENERILDTSGTAVITRPTTIDDDGVTRAPINGAIVEVVGASPTLHIYVAYLGAWMPLMGLDFDDVNPLGPQHDEGLAAMLAVRWAPPSMNLPINVAAMSERGMRDIETRFFKPIESLLDTGHVRRRTANFETF